MQGVSIDRLQIASVMLRGLSEFSAAAGLDFSSLVNAVGLQELDSESSDQYVNLDRFAKLLEIAAILTGDESFGLRYADWRFPRPTGPLSFAITTAPDVRTALHTLVKYTTTRIDVANIEVVVERDRMIIEWGFSPLFVRRWQLCDFSAATLMRQLRSTIDTQWRPLSVGLVRPPPRNLDMHRRVLGRALEFSQSTNFIALPISILDATIRDSSPELFKMSIQLLDRLLAERTSAADLISSVREEIVLALPSEEGTQLKRVARRLGMSVRSLQRHLAEYNTSFQQLVDETRRRLAVEYLEDPSLSFSQIAYQLGFSAPSAFTRASYRWFGRRPSAVRRELHENLAHSEVP